MTGDGSERSPLPERVGLVQLTVGVLALAVGLAPLPLAGHRVALVVLGLALACGTAVLLSARRSRRRSRRAAGHSVPLPAWADDLSPAQYEELSGLVGSLTRRVQRAEAAAGRARTQATQSREGIWQVVSAAVSSEEQVRRRFVEDLHDSVVQTIIAAAYLSEDEETPREEIAEYLRDAEKQLRDLMVLTRPPELEQRTLGEVTRRLTLGGALSGLDVQWDWVSAEVELPEVCANTLYRFFQESLNNVAKHAGVQSAQAGLEVDEELITAWVHDTGRGFHPPQAARSTGSGHHVGLELLNSRASQIGANVTIDSAPGEGTRVTLSMQRPPSGIDRPVPAGSIAA